MSLRLVFQACERRPPPLNSIVMLPVGFKLWCRSPAPEASIRKPIKADFEITLLVAETRNQWLAVIQQPPHLDVDENDNC
jgi:hypothetical protein